ncbi:MAG: hypothetical protein K6T51_10075 [Rubrobacteraceae bacterium]|nr:hypothetical protein [Rubrobacteraceae bacterium]
MIVGIALIVASTLAYNASVILLALAARRSRGGGASLAVSAGKRSSGIAGIALDVAGWVFEAASLTFIPLTLARIVSAAGLGFLLLLSSLALKEPLGKAKLAGAVLLVAGLSAAGVFPPSYGSASPTPWEWAALVASAGAVTAVPYALRGGRAPARPLLFAISSGVCYALSGILTKGLIDLLPQNAGLGDLLPPHLIGSALLLAGLIAASAAAFDAQLRALREMEASIAAPVILALHTVLPVAVAPAFFGEAWPSGTIPQTILGAGIVLTVAGALTISASSRGVR